MRDYVEAKVGEFDEKLIYVRGVVADLARTGSHPNVVAELERICLKIQELIGRIRSLLPLNLPHLFPRIQVMLAQITTRFDWLDEWYLPAIAHEGHDEIAVGRIIDQVLAQLGITWIADKVVSFSRALAMFPGSGHCPIFFMPRYTCNSLLNWIGLYHEIAHAIYQRFPEVASKLADAVLAYCEQQLRQTPALTATQLDRRTLRYRETLAYWDTFRLQELFCDIFATVVTGPAYLFSWVDVSLTSLDGPYSVALDDEHPPNAARTQACLLSLHDSYAATPLKNLTNDLWERFLDRRHRSPLYDQYCPFELVLAIVRTSQSEIQRLGFPAYQTPIATPPVSLSYTRTDNLAELVNVAVVNLLFERIGFVAWQKSMIERLCPPTPSVGGPS
jgi:hypothetical protein